MSIREVVRNLHSAIIAKDWEGVRNLYHKDFERYVFGSFHPNLIPNHEGVTGGLEFLFEHGTFIKFDFSEPIGGETKGEAVIRIHWEYVPNGSKLIFRATMLSNLRINETGLITFTDAYYDPIVLERVADAIHAAQGGAEEKEAQ